MHILDPTGSNGGHGDTMATDQFDAFLGRTESEQLPIVIRQPGECEAYASRSTMSQGVSRTAAQLRAMKTQREKAAVPASDVRKMMSATHGKESPMVTFQETAATDADPILFYKGNKWSLFAGLHR